VQAGGVPALVAMLHSGSPEAQTHAAGALWHLAALETNKKIITRSGAITPLVHLLSSPTEAHRFAAGALWHLASAADARVEMVHANATPTLVGVCSSPSAEARQHAAAVLSVLVRSQGSNKKELFAAGGVPALVHLLSDLRPMTQKHAACSLWGLADGKDLAFSAEIVSHGAVKPLVVMLASAQTETRGYAAACLSCLCAIEDARQIIREVNGVEPLLKLARGPPTWLRSQVTHMLSLLDISIPDADDGGGGGGGSVEGQQSGGAAGTGSPRREPAHAKMKYHFFSFQIAHVTGAHGFT